MSKPMSKEEASLTVATALMRKVATFKAENARLREALRPLAEARLFAGSDYWVISSEDMERARAALKGTEE